MLASHTEQRLIGEECWYKRPFPICALCPVLAASARNVKTGSEAGVGDPKECSKF
jgi:hypothetical protein